MSPKQAGVRRRANRGFSLIEALIAVVVLATGLLALTALQGALIRSSADAKARSQLVTFAQSLMDGARRGGYDAIATGTNTALLSTTAQRQAAAQAMGVADLTETTSVTPVANGTSEYKVINLRLGWTDATGAARTMRLSSVVSPLLLSQSVLNELDPPGSGSFRPIVRRPTPVTEGMIPIAVGGGEDTAATNPKPELVGRNNDTLVSDTRFELLTFNVGAGLVDGFVRFDKRIETAMVGCSCQTGLNGFPTGGSSPAINVLLRAKAFRPSYWDGTRYSEPEDASTPTRSPDTSVSQSQLCDVCCRDHEDPVGAIGPKFNPWLGTGVAHAHYLDPAGSAVTNGNFREACRVIRVNGLWRVTPDPKVQDLALLPTRVYPSTTGSTTAPADNNVATSPLVSAAGKTSYIAFAYDFIKQFFYDKTALTAANLASMQTAAGVNNPEYVPIKSGDTRWLHVRAILTDFLESDAVTKINREITNCTGTDTVTRAQCVLPYVPMATVNATEIAIWSGRAVSETGIVHTGTLALTSTLKNYGQALLNRFVSGLALVGPINPADDDDPIKDEQTFALVPGVIRSGTWLSVASPSGVLFGDPSNPSRGFATISGGTRFNVQLSGLPYASDTSSANDPRVNVGTVTPQPCNSANTTRGGNPFECTSDSTSNVVVAVGSFNYLQTTNGNINDPCDGVGKIGEGQAVCKAYTLTGGTLVSGTSRKPSEVSSVTLASVAAGNTYTLNFTAVNPDQNAIAVCNASNNWTGWRCE